MATERASTTSSGQQVSQASDLQASGPVSIDRQDQNPSFDREVFSPDSSQVVFETDASALTGGGTGFVVKNLATGDVTLVSGDKTVSPSDNAIFAPGGPPTVFFEAAPAGAYSPYNASVDQVYATNLSTGDVTLVSSDASGAPIGSTAHLIGVSATGDRVAFSAKSYDYDGYVVQHGTYVKDLSTGHVVQVGDVSTNLGTVSYDSALHEAAYITNSTSGQPSQVYAENLTDGSKVLVSANANSGSTTAFISSDGTKVAFDSFASNVDKGIFLKDLTTGTLTQLSTKVGLEAFTPQGDQIAYLAYTATKTYDPTSKDTTYTTTSHLQLEDISGQVGPAASPDEVSTQTIGPNASHQATFRSFTDVIYSPDGSKLAYRVDTFSGTTDMTTEQVLVYDSATGVISTIADGGSGNVTFSNLHFSPDSSKVAITQDTFDSSTGNSYQTIVYDLTTGTKTIVPDNGDGVYFAPDSAAFAYSSFSSDQVPGDTNGVEDVFVSSVCYGTGTLIRTARGEVAVEMLRVGDLAVTAAGHARPIRWLGHRTIDCRAHPTPQGVWPIRVAAHAFADGSPSTDLFLSAGHAVRVDVMGDVLVPIGKLVNGATVARQPVDEVTYWHVELDSHDILVANDMPAESFLDCGNRSSLLEQIGDFDRAAGPHTPTDFCLPYVEAGPIIGAVRERLAARAVRLGWTETRDLDLHLLVDGARLTPDVCGNIARFIFPATAACVVLASRTSVPSDKTDSIDHRRLGASIHGIEIDDGLGDRTRISLDDPRVVAGWHQAETEAGCFHRFTTGHLPLPVSLWGGCLGQVVLRLHYDPQAGSRWRAPAREPAAARAAP